MSNTTQDIGDDAVTISEALKRLDNQAPARQSFYSAVNKGKIREVTDKDNPKATRIVSWKSVLEYIAGGGFKSRQKSGTTYEREVETAASLTEQESMDSAPERVTEVCVAVESSTPAIPTKLHAVNQAGNTSTKTQAPQRCEQVPDNSGRKNNPAPRERANPKGNKKSVASDKPKGRRHLPLRIIKNNLRHLDYEQTKAIRDWTDNRLLNVLRPTPIVVSNDSES